MEEIGSPNILGRQSTQSVIARMKKAQNIICLLKYDGEEEKGI